MVTARMRKILRYIICLCIFGISNIPFYGVIPAAASVMIVLAAATMLYGIWTISERWESKDKDSPNS